MKQLAELLLAWALLLLIAGLLDAWLDTPIRLALCAWVLAGMAVARARKIATPVGMGQNAHVDVVSGFRRLWWLARWPAHLARRK